MVLRNTQEWMSKLEKINPPPRTQPPRVSGDGGSPGQPYTPPKENPNKPWVPAPRPKPKIANLHHDNKAGNVDEVWKVNPSDKYKKLPSKEQWDRNLNKARGMVQTADSRNLQKGRHPYITGVDEAVGEYPGRNAPDDLRLDPLRKGVKAYQQQKGSA